MEEWSGNRSDQYWDTLVSESADHPVLIVFSGNQHHVAFLLAPEPHFDFVDEVDWEIDSKAVAVPRRLVKAYFERTLRQLRTIVGRVRASGCPHVAVLGTPPPKGDIILFAESVRQSPYFAKVAQRQGIDLQTVNIMPARILLKMWRAIQELMRDIAIEGGATFIPVVPEAVDPNGFLAKDFYTSAAANGDITHANTKYGRLMLEAALQRLSETGRG